METFHHLDGIFPPTRFLVAIDRRNGVQVATETVKLAEEFMLSSDGLVIGIDLSGDPTVSHTVAAFPRQFYVE